MPIPIEEPPPEDMTGFPDWYHEFVKRLDDYLFEYRLARARGRSPDVVAAISFSQDYKEEIAGLLDRIRKIVSQADLESAKKDAIYGKIYALQLEIDRSTTAFGALLSRWLDLTNAIGESAENLEPAVKMLERIMRLFGRAKADHDQAQLPPPEEKKQLPAPETFDDPDDKIPF